MYICKTLLTVIAMKLNGLKLIQFGRNDPKVNDYKNNSNEFDMSR